MENLFLVVGLGNPGAEYARTRHNAGFLAVERVAERRSASWSNDSGFECRLARTEAGGRRVLLAEPQTFMNLSGGAVGRLRDFYRIPNTRLLVVVDDADLPLGEVRLRPRGSSGGHHGLESIELQLGSREYPRQRLGIGRTVDGRRGISGHVLGRFGRAETAMLEAVLARAADQIECWWESGIDVAMNQFNGTVTVPESSET